MRLTLADAAATAGLGARLAHAVIPGIIYLNGELGAGKTTLARGLIQGMGYSGKVRSPTYTLVEPYRFEDITVYHLDLYRLANAEELEWLGLRDMLAEQALLLVEWAQRGRGSLPAADLVIDLEYAGEGRQAVLTPLTGAGQQMLSPVGTQ